MLRRPLNTAQRFRRILAGPLEGLAFVFLVGVIGYRLIEGWSVLDAVWMVAITLSTIGYGEVHPLSDAGRLFTLLLIAMSLLWAGRFVSQLAQLIAEGGLLREWQEARLRQEMLKMKDHCVVVGFGRLGREIVAELHHQGAQVLVVDPKPPPPDLAPEIRYLQGDATHDEILQDAGIERAKAVAVATPSDAVNVYLALTVRQLAPLSFITVRVEEESARDKAHRAGADRVLLPYHLAGGRMAQAMLRPGTSAFVERAEHRHHADLQLDEVVIPIGSQAVGTLASLNIPSRFRLIVVAVSRQGEQSPRMPEATTAIGPGCVLVVVGARDDIQRFATWAASG